MDIEEDIEGHTVVEDLVALEEDFILEEDMDARYFRSPSKHTITAGHCRPDSETPSYGVSLTGR